MKIVYKLTEQSQKLLEKNPSIRPRIFSLEYDDDGNAGMPLDSVYDPKTNLVTATAASANLICCFCSPEFEKKALGELAFLIYYDQDKDHN